MNQYHNQMTNKITIQHERPCRETVDIEQNPIVIAFRSLPDNEKRVVNYVVTSMLENNFSHRSINSSYVAKTNPEVQSRNSNTLPYSDFMKCILAGIKVYCKKVEGGLTNKSEHLNQRSEFLTATEFKAYIAANINFITANLLCILEIPDTFDPKWAPNQIKQAYSDYSGNDIIILRIKTQEINKK